MAYTASSPYYASDVYNKQFLDVMINRSIPVDPTDKQWIITQAYNLRPDMLAYDLYGDSKLWWVFAQRNPNRLKDPLFDFVEGTTIYLPNVTALQQALGL